MVQDTGSLIKISIHALREEGDAASGTSVPRKSVFLSTPSARRATAFRCRCCRTHRYFYPRPPRGGRRLAKIIGHALNAISIHALREEGDAVTQTGSVTSVNFYPRPPRGGRPIAFIKLDMACYFYPRPPRGGRRKSIKEGHIMQGFLSTPSARRATVAGWSSVASFGNFYPRPPRGGRQCPAWSWKWTKGFLSTPSARRATEYSCGYSGRRGFLSTPSARRATRAGGVLLLDLKFLSTPSARRATC